MNNQIQGKKNKASGADFELRVRKDLENKGWVVDKWSNQVEFDYVNMGEITEDSKPTHGKIIPAKHKWNGPNRPMAFGTGFPDFIAFRRKGIIVGTYDAILCEVIGVESKSNGNLDKIEKQKCKWYLDNNIFSKIYIAEKIKISNRILINYINFEDKYGKK